MTWTTCHMTRTTCHLSCHRESSMGNISGPSALRFAQLLAAHLGSYMHLYEANIITNGEVVMAENLHFLLPTCGTILAAALSCPGVCVCVCVCVCVEYVCVCIPSCFGHYHLLRTQLPFFLFPSPIHQVLCLWSGSALSLL